MAAVSAGYFLRTAAQGARALAVSRATASFIRSTAAAASSSSRPISESARWYGSDARSEPAAQAFELTTTSKRSVIAGSLEQVLLTSGLSEYVWQARQKLGRYTTNENAWRRVAERLEQEASDDNGRFSRMSMAELLKLTRLLAQEVGITKDFLWDAVTTAASRGKVMDSADATVAALLELCEIYVSIQAWKEEPFKALLLKLQMETAVHTMEPSELARVLDVYSRAGAASKEISIMSTRLFNEAELRILEDADEVDADPIDLQTGLSVIKSMARLKVRGKEAVLRHLARDTLHKDGAHMTLPGRQVAELCNAYGDLGWRHDTVFRDVVTEILEEQLRAQRARILGQQAHVGAANAGDTELKYSSSDIALVALALLRLKMYRGNTDWFAWGVNYQELLDVLVRRMGAENELQTMAAQPLAAAAFVLGRARRGTEDLYKAMYVRMTDLLEQGSSSGAAEHSHPQEELERFLHGLAMMGPTRPKSIDAQWLMQWVCKNVWSLTVPDLIRINRHLVMIRCFDKEYLQMFVPFYCEPKVMNQLSKSDIMELNNTYNGARIREEDVGRHFFWAMGKRFQRIHVDRMGVRRPPLKRVG